jgi:hypothetical protein
MGNVNNKLSLTLFTKMSTIAATEQFRILVAIFPVCHKLHIAGSQVSRFFTEF